MPAPLPPQHYPELKYKRRPWITPGTWVNLLHSLYYLVPLLVLLGIGWWIYSLQNYPQVRYLPLASGGGVHALIEGRDDKIIKYTDLASGQVFMLPIESLSRWGQVMAQIMPANAHFSFPFECSLTDKNGKIIRVRVKGHTATLVKFTLLSNGVDYLYPLANLSPSVQSWILSLPVAENQSLDSSTMAQAADPVYVQHLQERLAQVQQDMLDAKARAEEPVNSGMQKEVYLKQVKDDKQEILYLQNKLNAALNHEETPKQPPPTPTAGP